MVFPRRIFVKRFWGRTGSNSLEPYFLENANVEERHGTGGCKAGARRRRSRLGKIRVGPGAVRWVPDFPRFALLTTVGLWMAVIFLKKRVEKRKKS